MKIYVIVVTFNGAIWVEKCFGSLTHSTIPLQILNIDNASSDGTPEKVIELFPQVEQIKSSSNLGFGKANNIGLKIARENNADYVFLLNQDAWIESDTVEKLAKIALVNSNYGILSPLHMNGDGSALDYNFSLYISSNLCPGLVSDFVTNNIKPIYETKYVNAAAWLLSNKCLNKIGGFDPIFPHYGEDDDYLNRTIFHQLKIGIIPSTKIYHDRVYKSSSQIEFDKTRLFIRNILQLKKYPNSFTFNLVFFIKNQLEDLFSSLILRDYNKFNLKLQMLIKTLLNTKRILKSKKFFSKENSAILLNEEQLGKS